jgi:methionyl-tRNA formyltransferase
MAILQGEKETGMTIIRMDEKFDHGPIISQFKEEIRIDDTSETLYRRLFTKGAEVLTTILPAWVEGRISPRQQDHSQATLAPRLTRDDGFIPWKLMKKALQNENVPNKNRPNQWKMVNGKWPIVVERATRALYPWPGVWTLINTPKGSRRLKILSAHLDGNRLTLDNIQLEGKQSTSFSRFQASLA